MDINLREFQTPMMESSETARTVRPLKNESRSMLKLCQTLLKASEKYQSADDRLDKWERLGKKLRGDYGQKEGEPIVESIAGDTYNTIRMIGVRRPRIRVTPKSKTFIAGGFGPVDNVRNAKYREAAINQEFERITIQKQVKKAVLDGICPFGYGLVKIGWGIETTFDPTGVEKISSEGLWARRHRPTDFFPGVLGDDDESMPYVIWRLWVPKKKAKKNELWNQDIIGKMTQSSVPKTIHSDEDRSYGAELDLLELFEFHHIEEGWIAVMTRHGDDFVRLPHDNPYMFKGMHGAIYRPGWDLNDDFYGRSQAELTERQAGLINETRRKALDHIRAFPALVKDNRPDADQLNEQWKFTPYGGKLNNPGGKVGDIEIVSVPAVSRDFYAIGDQARQDAMWVLGKSDMSHGQAGDMKATQAAIINGRENANLGDMSDGVAETYRVLADKCGDLLVQYMSGEQILACSGELPDGIEPFATYSVRDIVGNFDHSVDVESNSAGNNEMKAQAIINGIQQIVNPAMGELSIEIQRRYDIVEMYKKAQKLLGIDLEEFKKDEEQQPTQNDPYTENQHALSGGLLDDPQPGEEWHIPIHEAVAHATRSEEIARHVLKHRGVAANTEQGVQQDQMEQQAQAMQPPPGPQAASPMPGMARGVPQVAQVNPQGLRQQVNPMAR